MRLKSLHSLTAVLFLLAPGLCAQEVVPTAEEANALVQAGQFQEAASAWKKRADADESDGRAHFMWAYSLHGAGDLDAAHDAHIDAARFPQFTTLSLYNHACVHALRNEKDAAFKALDEALAVGFNRVEQLRTDTDMDNLREDDRFKAILNTLVSAQEASAPTAPAEPKPIDLANLPATDHFNFYLGNWDMSDGAELKSQLDVKAAFDGSGLSVTSTDAKDGSVAAQSLFLFDEAKGLWRQIWMAKSGMVVVLEGGLAGSAMILEQVSQDGEPVSGARSVFSNITSNGFTYEWQESSDGEHWETLATRLFTRS